MEINLEQFQQKILADKESANNNYNNNNNIQRPTSQYKKVYPFNDGQYEFRIFYNFKSQIVQRPIIRHGNEGKNAKVICLSAFGEDCPACKAVRNIENALGKDCGVSRKFGAKKKGVCFAQLINAPAKVFEGEYAPKKGDVVLLMYPKTVYDAFTTILDSALNNGKIDELVNKNVAYHIIINRDNSKGPNGYQVVQTFTQSKMFPTDEEFEKFISELPPLNEEVVNSKPTEQDYRDVKAFAETLESNYIGGNVVNPNSAVVENTVKSTAAKLDAIIDSTPPQNSYADESELKEIVVDDDDVPFETANNDETPKGMPECFGKYNKTSHNCWLCPHDIECQKCNA